MNRFEPRHQQEHQHNRSEHPEAHVNPQELAQLEALLGNKLRPKEQDHKEFPHEGQGIRPEDLAKDLREEEYSHMDQQYPQHMMPNEHQEEDSGGLVMILWGIAIIILAIVLFG